LVPPLAPLHFDVLRERGGVEIGVEGGAGEADLHVAHARHICGRVLGVKRGGRERGERGGRGR
jgi:hypothetical protein